ncbi:hypothetical protein ABZ626_37530 [Streptomyces longispororuber]|uniref:hypothetical protein n=1 Tax=Streptomyces longispororuber TaxID=68230 RepID=UPI0033CCC847
MDAFTAGLLQRIKATESDLAQARRTGDDFLAEVELSELEDLHRLAAEHGVEVAVPSS